MDAHSHDTEKKIDSFEASKDFDPVLVDPAEELSLHRGLKARQISMITVLRILIMCLANQTKTLLLYLAGRLAGHRPHHRFRYCSRQRRSTRSLVWVLLHGLDLLLRHDLSRRNGCISPP